MSPLVRRLLRWYRRDGRAGLPWRTVRSPYRTIVSEFMLAQTQVDRVVPKFESFVVRFPNFEALARASLADVVREWKGLGYNSRALRLHALARQVVERFGGELPADRDALRSLPGIGAYTLAAVRAFAFGIDDVAMDTNLRRVVHRLSYGMEYPPAAGARELDERARSLVPPGRAYEFNSAMMDIGATICTARAPKCLICPLQTDCAAAPIDSAMLDRARTANRKPLPPQAAVPFEQSRRYARGRIVDRLRELPPGRRISLLDLHRDVAAQLGTRSVDGVREIVGALERDGLVTNDGTHVALRE